MSATSSVMGEVEDRSALARRIAAAFAAQEEVRRLCLDERLSIIRRVGERIAAERDVLIDTLIAEGSIRRVATASVEHTVKMAECYADYIDLIRPQPMLNSKTGWIRREPYGVAGIFSPANAPLTLTFVSLAAAFGAGNAAVIRPSAMARRASNAVIEKFVELAPPGSIQGTTCPSEPTADEFASNPAVRAVLIYGGSSLGKGFMTRLGKHYEAALATRTGYPHSGSPFKKYIAELGGNDALVVLPGADAARVAPLAATAAFTHAGQMCFSTKRILVHRSLFDEFVEKIVRVVRQLKVGPPADPATDIGPLLRPESRGNALRQLEDAVARGGEVLVGGTHDGPYIHPTIVRFEPDAILDRALEEKPLLWAEECFGPIRSIVPFEDEEVAFKLASDTVYGIGASLYGPPEKCMAFADRLKVGRVIINETPLYISSDLPIGGVGDSGFYGATNKIVELTYAKLVHVGSEF